MKKVTTINIDEDVLEQAKKEIPNISLFCEGCLKTFLGLDGGIVGNIESELSKMKKAQLNIHILSQAEYENKISRDLSSKENNSVWLGIWRNYCNTHQVIPGSLEKASKALGFTSDFLEEMMDTLNTMCSREETVLCDEWTYAFKKYMEFKSEIEYDMIAD